MKMLKACSWSDGHSFSVPKRTEGGMGQKLAMFLLTEAGIPCAKDYSPYVGHTGLRVLSRNQRVIARANTILYVRGY